jgi:hypothetical protein
MTADTFTVLMRGHLDIDEHRIACPHCAADQGLRFRAQTVDSEAMVSCSCGYDWWDERISGEAVHDLFLALTGHPTRTTTVRNGDEVCPREQCSECEAFQAESKELGLFAAAATGAEREVLGARCRAVLAAWVEHLAVHLDPEDT